MGNYIECGKMNRNYIYIILAALFDILKNILYGKNHNQSFKDLKLYDDEIQNKLSRHIIMHDFFNYLGTVALALISYKYEKFSSERNLSFLINSEKEKAKGHIILIHNNENIENFQNCRSFSFCLFIIFIWILEEQLMKISIDILQDLDFWMIEILIISFFTLKMFKIEIFKHQIFAMALNIIPCLLKAGSIYLSFKDNTNEKYIYTGKLPIYYVDNRYIIVPGIITYLILIIFRSFVNANIKWYMDLKYIPLNKLLSYYGIIGAFLCFIIILISTFNECQSVLNMSTEANRTYYFSDYVCKVKKNDTQEIFNDAIKGNFSNVTYYFENFQLYFKEFKKIEIIKELSVIILGILTHFLSQYFSLIVIKYLTPIHIIFSIPIRYIMEKMFLVFHNIIFKKKFFKTKDIYKRRKICLDVCGDLVSVLGFLIYLELIVLKFCKIDYNVKENIIRRSFGESYGINKKGNNANENEAGTEKSFESEDIVPEDESEENMDLIYK